MKLSGTEKATRPFPLLAPQHPVHPRPPYSGKTSSSKNESSRNGQPLPAGKARSGERSARLTRPRSRPHSSRPHAVGSLTSLVLRRDRRRVGATSKGNIGLTFELHPRFDPFQEIGDKTKVNPDDDFWQLFYSAKMVGKSCLPTPSACNQYVDCVEEHAQCMPPCSHSSGAPARPLRFDPSSLSAQP